MLGASIYDFVTNDEECSKTVCPCDSALRMDAVAAGSAPAIKLDGEHLFVNKANAALPALPAPPTSA